MNVNDTQGREYLETHLTDTMEAGSAYCLSFYLAFGNTPGICTATSAFGAYFSTDTCQYSSSAYNVINVVPQANNGPSNIISDTLNWRQVNMIFHAIGGEQFVTIGNFWGASYNVPNSLTTCSNGGVAYYFIDDVSIVLLPIVNAGSDANIMYGDSITLSGAISETWPGMQFEWFPHTGLDDPYDLSTSAHPDSNTTYVLTVSCPTCEVPCLSEVTDSVTIFVQGIEPPQLFPLRVPTLFTTEQYFHVDSLPQKTRLKIFDSRGRLIYFNDNYNNDYYLTGLNSAIYTYELELADNRKFTGKFAVIQR